MDHASLSASAMRRDADQGVVGVTYFPTEPRSPSTLVFKSKVIALPTPAPVPPEDPTTHATTRAGSHQRVTIGWGGLTTPAATYDGETFIIRL